MTSDRCGVGVRWGPGPAMIEGAYPAECGEGPRLGLGATAFEHVKSGA